jgi:hypothetical protein
MRPRLEKLLGTSILIAALFLFPFSPAAAQPKVLGVASIGMTVSEMDRSVEFFSQVLTFKKVSETEFHSEQYDRLVGIFGIRVRVVKMKLGQEMIELAEYLTPQGRPIPLESAATISGFSISQLSCATWMQHTNNCVGSTLNTFQPNRSEFLSGTRLPLACGRSTSATRTTIH